MKIPVFATAALLAALSTTSALRAQEEAQTPDAQPAEPGATAGPSAADNPTTADAPSPAKAEPKAKTEPGAAAAVKPEKAAALTTPGTVKPADAPTIHVGGLIQPTFQVTAPYSPGFGSDYIGAPSGPEGNGISAGRGRKPSFDFFVRRARVSVFGSPLPHVSFFVDSDLPDLGKGGYFVPSMFVQDAFLTYSASTAFNVDAGLMLVPFSHHTIESAATLSTLDYHLEMIRFPAGKNFRDAGVEVRGLITDHFLYRVGAFEGVRNYAALKTPVEPVTASYPDVNTTGLPRFTGQVRVNLVGSEGDFFLKGIYFSPTPMISVGLGGDFQPKAVLKLDTTVGTYSALSGDIFVEYPFAPEDELLLKANVFKYGEGWSRIDGSTALESGGTAYFAELGFRHTWLEPLVYVEYLKTKFTDVAPINIRDAEIFSPHAGVNVWIERHTFNIKADFGFRRWRKDVRTDPTGNGYNTVTFKDLLGTVQAQVSF